MRGHRRLRQASAALVAISASAALALSLHAQGNIQTAVNAAYAKYLTLQDGKNADYIPALAKVDPNPLVNPVALTATSMMKGESADEVSAKIIGTYSDFAGRPLSVLSDIYKSESDTNQRNQAIGMLMYAYEYIKSNPAQATELYTRQCSVGVNAKDLAAMAATLAFGGKNPLTGKQVLSAANVPYVLAVMATAGLYDDSGKWLYHTGLPAKSGVGGGIIAVSPGNFGIAVVSPPLDDAGNSVRAQKAIRDISTALNGNPYSVKGERAVATS